MSTRRRFFLCHYAGFTFASAIISGGGVWYPVHMSRAFGWGPSKIGLTLGIVVSGAGIIGQPLCGRVVDSMFRRGYRDAQFRWFAACMALATPIGIIALTNANPWVFLVGIGIFLVLVSSISACAITALNLVTPNELRGTGVSFWAATAGLIGASSGPVLIAIFAKQFPNAFGMGYGTAILIGICCPLTAICLALGFRAMREGVAEAERWTATT
jgi:MFS family permease